MLFQMLYTLKIVMMKRSPYSRRRNVDLSSHTANGFFWIVICDIQNLFLETSVSILRMPVISGVGKKNLSPLIFD
jgi:hypothetical protein